MFKYIDKIKVAVRACMTGEEPQDGRCSLLPQSPFHGGPETILELLNTGPRMIPLLIPERSEVLLLNGQDLNWVMAGASVPSDFVCPPAYLVTHEETVHITFRDGRELPGLVQMEQPEGMNRVSDFLNLPEDFFPVRFELGHALVNKSQIRTVRLLCPSPAPIVMGSLLDD